MPRHAPPSTDHTKMTKSHHCPEAAQTGSAPEGNRLVNLIWSIWIFGVCLHSYPRILVTSLIKGHLLPGWHSLSSKLLFYLHTGRIPEGHRKGAKSPFKWLSEQSCKKTCIPEANQKDTGRIPEGKVQCCRIGMGLLL